LGAPRGDDHVGTRVGEGQSDGTADAATGAGHDRRLPIEPEQL